MAMTSLSDLSQMFQLRRDTVRVRQDLTRAAQELSSGKKADLGKAVYGNYSPLVSLDQQLSALAAYETNTKEAAVFTDAAQASLERVKQVGSDLGVQLIGLEEMDLITIGAVFANEAASAFEAAVSALNTSAGGRSVFAGAATDRAPLASAGSMLDEIRTMVATASATTADEIAAVLDDYFYTTGGGFETNGYTGSLNRMSSFRVSEDREVTMTIRADDTTIRDQLRALALGAMLDEPGLTSPSEKDRLASLAGEAMITNGDRLLSLQAQVGTSQARIETASAQNASEKTALRMARNDIVSADPYDAATELQNLQTQLETIYTITARLSGLSLTNYLR